MKLDKFLINKGESLEFALEKIDQNKLGAIFVEDRKKVIGIATDGDIRRILLKKKDLSIKISKCMNKDFVFLFEKSATKENILKLLDTRVKIIPVLDKKNNLVSVISEKNISWNEKEKIISKAKSPVRISFAGSGTDLTAYFYKESGAVLNATINKFTHATLEKRKDQNIKIYSSDLDEQVKYKSIHDLKFDGKLDLIKSVIKILNPSFGFNLITYSDVPPGSGLGGSAVLLSAIIGAFNNFRENKYTDHEIAEIAFHAERVVLNLSGGWQDQYATVFGGFNFIEFKDNENIVHPLRIAEDVKNELEDSLILCYTGINHNSDLIHKEQRKQMANKKEKKYAQISKDIAFEMKSKLLKRQLDNFGELLGKAWEIKKQFSSKITSPALDKMYNFAIKNGALGGKLLGAGGGGYFLFYVPANHKLKFINSLKKKGLLVESFTFDDTGLRWWTTKKSL